MSTQVSSYKELIVWQKSFQLVLIIYSLTKHFPKEEVYGLSSQMRRAAISVTSNIAEGSCRRGTKEFVQFLHIANGSTAELDTQLLISFELKYITQAEFAKASELLNEVRRMLIKLIKSLKEKLV